MTRPRESLLNLFDPLSVTNTQPVPSQSSHDSSDLSSSDKENSQPPGAESAVSNPRISMTAFFNRKLNRPISVKTLPNGKLIDFSMDRTDGDSDEEKSIEDFGGAVEQRTEKKKSVKAELDTPLRPILADLPPESDASSFRLLGAMSPESKSLIQPSGSLSLACTLPALALSSPTPTLDDLPSCSILTPPVTVPPVTAFLAAPEDARSQRQSFDPHLSFDMHLRESSFDLLNDRISFSECDLLTDIEPFGETSAISANPEAHPMRAIAVFEDETNKSDLADIESGSDVDSGSTSDHLSDSDANMNHEVDCKSQAGTSDPANLATPKYRSAAGPVPRAPQARKFLTGTRTEPTSSAVPEASGASSSSSMPQPPTIAAPIAALRTVKRTKVASRASSVSGSTTSASSSQATEASFPLKAVSRVPLSATLPRPSKVPLAGVSRYQKTSAPEAIAVAPTSRPSTASLLKYGPQGRKGSSALAMQSELKERSLGPGQSRPQAMARPRVMQKVTAAVTDTARTVPKASTLPAPSSVCPPARPALKSARDAQGPMARTESATSVPSKPPARLKAAVSTIPVQQPRRDIAKILRGPARQQTITKRI